MIEARKRKRKRKECTTYGCYCTENVWTSLLPVPQALEGRTTRVSIIHTRVTASSGIFFVCVCAVFFFLLLLLAFSRFSLKIPDLHRYSCSIAGMMGETPLMACVGRQDTCVSISVYKNKKKFMDGGKMGWIFQVRSKVGMSGR